MQPPGSQSLAGLSDLLGRRMDGVARIRLEHHRCQRFRWMALLEVTLGITCLICLLPLIILIALYSEADLEFPSIRGRFRHYWHEIRLTLLDPHGTVLAVSGQTPASEEEGDGLVASVLAAADRERVVVVETLDAGAVSETIEVWYGGRLLLAHPDEAVEERAAAMLRHAGLVIRDEGDAVSVDEPIEQRNVVVRVFGALLTITFAPLLVFLQSGRDALRMLPDFVMGRGEWKKTITVRAECIATKKIQGRHETDPQLVDTKDLLGITFSPTLGYDRDVKRREASLRLVGRTRSVSISFQKANEAGRSLRDFLVAANLRLRRARPELGLLGEGPHPTHCPYCTTLYLMQPGSRCPSCGAFAGSAL